VTVVQQKARDKDVVIVVVSDEATVRNVLVIITHKTEFRALKSRMLLQKPAKN
jgi:3-hydroxyisobutyrate dehydrogenase-like beta-hydroxyacid dehydrogenase